MGHYDFPLEGNQLIMHREVSITGVLFRSSICPVKEPDTTEILE